MFRILLIFLIATFASTSLAQNVQLNSEPMRVGPALNRSNFISGETILLNDLDRLKNSPALIGGAKLRSVNPLVLLDLAAVRNEMNISAEQFSEINELEQAFERKIIDAWNNAPGNEDVSVQPITEAGKAELEKLSKQRDKEIESALNKNQRKRLKQIFLQFQIRSMGTADALLSEEFARSLRLTNSDKQRISKRAKEIDAELQLQISELIDKARKKMLRELSQQQDYELKELIGEPFDFEKLNRKNQ